MNKPGNVTIEVTPKMCVPKATAEACLALVSLYLNEHSDKVLTCRRNDDGSYDYKIEDEDREEDWLR